MSNVIAFRKPDAPPPMATPIAERMGLSASRYVLRPRQLAGVSARGKSVHPGRPILHHRVCARPRSQWAWCIAGQAKHKPLWSTEGFGSERDARIDASGCAGQLGRGGGAMTEVPSAHTGDIFEHCSGKDG